MYLILHKEKKYRKKKKKTNKKKKKKNTKKKKKNFQEKKLTNALNAGLCAVISYIQHPGLSISEIIQ